MNIISIDDNEKDRFFLSKILKNIGFNCASYEGIDEAFKKSPETDVVFCDLNLKKTWGDESILKARSLWPDAYLIILTGIGGSYLTGSVAAQMIRWGATEVLSKDNVKPNVIKHVLEDYQIWRNLKNDVHNRTN